MAARLQIRRDTAANWTSVNPTLAQGEIGFETDTRKAKAGDGTTAWADLDYWIGDMFAATYDPTGIEADAFDRANHTGSQLAATISDLSTVATSGSYTDLSDTPTLGTAAATDSSAYATATQGGKADTAIQPDDNATDLGSGAATDGQILTADGAGGVAWEESQGDMLAATYDPNSVEADAFNRANHTGTQLAATISDLATVATSGSYDDLSDLPDAFTVSLSDTPPETPEDNALWWRSTDGRLFIRYNDGDTQQWVSVSPAVRSLQSRVIAKGDITSTTIAPVITEDRIYTANLTADGGTLTITPAGATEYSACLLALTSGADGTYEIGIAGTPQWINGEAVALAPATGETIMLLVQSVSGSIYLTAETWSTPA
jgi:hypothetical protein